MVSVSNIRSSVMGSITNVKKMQKWCDYFQKNKEKALAYAVITSVAGKDAIGGVMYVTQSLNNKKIPDDKRRFVASLDATNCLLMIASQLALFFAMRKINEPIFNRLFRKSFDKEGKVIKTAATQLRINQRNAGLSPENTSRKLPINKEYKKLRNDSLETFKFISELVASTIIAKRVIVPFLATPMAQKLENYVTKKNAKKQQNLPPAADGTQISKPVETVQASQSVQPELTQIHNTNMLDKFMNNNKK